MFRLSNIMACALMMVSTAVTLPAIAGAQGPDTRKKVTSDADLPRFSYPTTVPPSTLLTADDATFEAFTRKVGADIDSVLTGYTIDDKQTLRMLLGASVDVQMLLGDREGAIATVDRLDTLQEKPSAKAMSSLLDKAILKAWTETGTTSGAAYEQALTKNFTTAVNALPWIVVQDRVKSMKASFLIVSPSLILSDLKTDADPAALKSNSMDFASARGLVSDRFFERYELPIQRNVVAILTPYIQAHDVPKVDIWPAREVILTGNEKLTPVRIGIWDSGVDTALYPKQLFTDPRPGLHGPHGLAFDMEGKLYAGDLQPLTADQTAVYPRVVGLEQGMNDLQSNIDSPAATAARKFLSTTPPAELTPFFRQMDFLGQWMHGTHVAGIAVKGNPAAELVVAQFNDALAKIPFAPTVEWANRFKGDFRQIGDYFREHNVRVVNMSWADSQSEIEQWLTNTSAEKDPLVRKQLALQIYSIWKDAVEGAIKAAPDTLFVCAAGNSNSNAGFLGDVPASLHLPNLITVGAVDQAGEETSFTSYGDTVVLHADGFQVESYIPGGTKIKFSGTSMASPNVVNLAAKLIALNPALTPAQTIALMEKGADTSPDGRRHVVNPKATVALLQQPAH